MLLLDSRDPTRLRRFRAMEAVRTSTPPETEYWQSVTMHQRQDILAYGNDPTSRFEVLLARDVSRCEKVCSRLSTLPTVQGRPTEAGGTDAVSSNRRTLFDMVCRLCWTFAEVKVR